MIVVVDDYGVNSPMLLYFAHAKGWSFDADTVTAHVVRTLEPQGARYFAIDESGRRCVAGSRNWRRICRRATQPVLVDAPADTVLFDLRLPGKAGAVWLVAVRLRSRRP